MTPRNRPYLMAHRTRWMQVRDLLTYRASPAGNNPPVWQLIVATIVIVVLIGLAGQS
jgi:hypothetical protein